MEWLRVTLEVIMAVSGVVGMYVTMSIKIALAEHKLEVANQVASMERGFRETVSGMEKNLRDSVSTTEKNLREALERSYMPRGEVTALFDGGIKVLTANAQSVSDRLSIFEHRERQ